MQENPASFWIASSPPVQIRPAAPIPSARDQEPQISTREMEHVVCPDITVLDERSKNGPADVPMHRMRPIHTSLVTVKDGVQCPQHDLGFGAIRMIEEEASWVDFPPERTASLRVGQLPPGARNP